MNIEHLPQLADYLKEKGYLDAGETPVMSVLAGGVSNRTVLVERTSGPDLVLKQALERLRVDVEWRSDPARIHWEAEGIRILQSILPSGGVPNFVFEDPDHHILAMEAVPRPHTNWKADLLEGRIDSSIVRQFGRHLGLIHRSFDAASHPTNGRLRNRDFFESLRIEPYYAYTAAQKPAAAPFLQKLIEETRAHAVALVHGDYSPKNVLVHRGRMVLLDHEVIHIGDPAFDIGFSLTHFLCKANHLRAHAALFEEAARLYWESYSETASRGSTHDELEARAVRHTLACSLARVAGRSPVEYLAPEARIRQERVVLALMRRRIGRILVLVDLFVQLVSDST